MMKNKKWRVPVIMLVGLLLAIVPDLESRAIGLVEYPETGETSGGGDGSDEPSYSPSDRIPDSISGSGTGSDAVQGVLYESYNDRYDLYEESLNDLYFFYCNISNGGFAAPPVYFDIPANLTYTLEKGGVQIPYTAGEEINEIGNYVLRISGDYEGTVYQGTFRFTLREEVTDGMVLLQEDMAPDSDEEISREMLDAITEAAGAQLEEQQQNITSIRTGTAEEVLGMAQEFYMETEVYRYTLKTGTLIEANVPNGAIVNGDVSVYVPETVTISVYRDGEPYETAGTNFSEEGIYRIVFKESSLSFATSYMSEQEYPMLVFRIAREPIGGVGIYNAPLHTGIIQVVYEGEPIYGGGDADGDEAPSLSYYRMEEDGRYSFVMRDEAAGYTYSLDIVRDTQAPQFDISIKNGRADIVYLSTDIKVYELMVDGVSQTEFSPVRMEGRGSYELTVIDAAGNKTSADFILTDVVNYASVTVIAILLLLATGAYIIMRRIHGSFRTR